MNENTHDNLTRSEVRVHFDEVLVKEISRLIEIDPNSASLSFNLATITCLLLAVERDKEISNFSDMPPKRYNRDTFLKEIESVGLEIDDDLLVAFQSLTQYGYVVIGADDLYYSQISAFALVNFLDNLFPGMPGINLVAFVIQHIDEVVTGRKDLFDAKDKFEQTLVTRGVALSEQTMKKNEEIITRDAAKKGQTDFVAGKSKSEIKEIKTTFSKSLKKLRSYSGQKQTIHSIEAFAKKTGKIKSIFPQQEEEIPDTPSPDAPSPDKPESDSEKELKQIKEDLKKREEELRKREEEDIKKQEEIRLKQEKEIEIQKEKERQIEIESLKSEMAKKEAEKIAHETEMKKMIEQLEKNKDEKKDEEVVQKTKSSSDVGDIASRIASLEVDLSITCPMCSTGNVIHEMTDQNKEYYECKNDVCNFISWSKPYHFECPLCKNNYLVETADMSSGTSIIGLKCPRAGCAYQQNNLNAPSQNIIQQTSGDSEKPKKKRRIIKRVKRKR